MILQSETRVNCLLFLLLSAREEGDDDDEDDEDEHTSDRDEAVQHRLLQRPTVLLFHRGLKRETGTGALYNSQEDKYAVRLHCTVANGANC